MTRVESSAYVIDPADPRAPSQEQWDAMTTEARAAVAAALPASPEPLLGLLPEGDRHRKAKTRATDALDRYFSRTGRRVYVSSELSTYYPGEPVFAPDVLAVLDADPGERSSWVVSREGKGLDFVLEVSDRGRASKDTVDNVQRYARLGVSEYFVLDLARNRLLGYRLPDPLARAYTRLLPQRGVVASAVLGLGLALEERRIRFYLDEAPLPEAEELIARLDGIVNDVLERRLVDAEDRAAAAEARAEAEAEARQAEAEARQALEAELAAARARVAELERGRS